MSDPVAVYGAVVATFALGWGAAWSIYSYWVTHRTKIRIQPFVDYLLAAPDQLRYVLYLNLINESHHPVRVSHLIFRAPDNSSQASPLPQAYPQGAPLPTVIPARDGFATWLPKSSLDAAFYNGKNRTRIEAYTVLGKVFKTKWLTVKDVPGAEGVPSELPATLKPKTEK